MSPVLPLIVPALHIAKRKPYSSDIPLINSLIRLKIPHRHPHTHTHTHTLRKGHDRLTDIKEAPPTPLKNPTESCSYRLCYTHTHFFQRITINNTIVIIIIIITSDNGVGRELRFIIIIIPVVWLGKRCLFLKRCD